MLALTHGGDSVTYRLWLRRMAEDEDGAGAFNARKNPPNVQN